MISKSFIEEFHIDEQICDQLINFFNTDEYVQTQKGLVDTNRSLSSQRKKSIDVSLPIKYKHPAMSAYRKALSKSCFQYMKKYPYCHKFEPWDILEHVNIQYYKPTWGYTKFHTEMSGTDKRFSARHLVFMTYLNTVTDGGETEFYHQDIKVNPVKGKTLIWPSDWTHTHRGIPSPSQEKYIITGWYSFV